ncbi:Uncharacterised protein [Mycobacterium tuberculosis]|nr:Uncharacterised protein [Mycobacterium tuberculosis]
MMVVLTVSVSPLGVLGLTTCKNSGLQCNTVLGFRSPLGVLGLTT